MPDGPCSSLGTVIRPDDVNTRWKLVQYHPVLHVACGDLPVRPKLVLASPPGPGVAGPFGRSLLRLYW